MEHSLFTSILFATVVAGTPLVLTALGELVTERSGVLNLGAEGIMAVGAISAFAATCATSPAHASTARAVPPEASRTTTV